jgi:hypothetical protein
MWPVNFVDVEVFDWRRWYESVTKSEEMRVRDRMKINKRLIADRLLPVCSFL